jgi:hypothetical protein
VRERERKSGRRTYLADVHTDLTGANVAAASSGEEKTRERD